MPAAGLDASAQTELTDALKQLEESNKWEQHLGALLAAQVPAQLEHAGQCCRWRLFRHATEIDLRPEAARKRAATLANILGAFDEHVHLSQLAR